MSGTTTSSAAAPEVHAHDLRIAAHSRPLTELEWLTTKEAAEHTRRPSVRAFYAWRDRHFIDPAKLYRRVELDQAIARDNRAFAKSGRALRLAGKAS